MTKSFDEFIKSIQQPDQTEAKWIADIISGKFDKPDENDKSTKSKK